MIAIGLALWFVVIAWVLIFKVGLDGSDDADMFFFWTACFGTGGIFIGLIMWAWRALP